MSPDDGESPLRSAQVRTQRPVAEILRDLSTMEDLAARYAPKAKQMLEGGTLKNWPASANAAAAMVRVPGLLRGVRIFAEARLVIEAEALLRVLLELGITSLWVTRPIQRPSLS